VSREADASGGRPATARGPRFERETVAAPCRACGAPKVEVFYRLEGVPVHSAMVLEAADAARDFPTGDLAIGLCDACGLVSNTAFDAAAHSYGAGYEESQACSPTFSRYATDLAQRLVDRHDLKGRTVLELGCGKGEFLALLCKTGAAKGIGIDPAFVPERLAPEHRAHVQGVQELFDESHAPLVAEADFVCCRHTYEHIGHAFEFLSLLRRLLDGRADVPVFFDVPEGRTVMHEGAFSEVYYEHCSYFSPGSLSRIFQRAGFRVLDVWTEYAGQSLLLEARADADAANAPLPDAAEAPEAMRESVDRYCDIASESIARWGRLVRERAAAGETVVLWGSGSRAVSFLTTIGLLDLQEVAAVVDINPHRQGRHMPGVPQRIVEPAALREIRPSLVIAMNPLYVGEIQGDLDRLGLDAELLAL